MVNKINWLHISDLHIGQKKQNILLPKVKEELFRDIETLKNTLGKIDVVFFTGDLTQSGAQPEFDELTSFLNELWSHFSKMGSQPYLVAIPGNHDLQRQDNTKAAVKVLKGYHEDSEFRALFWETISQGSEYLDVVNNSFHNFTSWYENMNLPKPPIKKGVIPGDICTVMEINGIKLGCLGLNTAFLELTSDDYFGKLAINPAQVLSLTSGDNFAWVRSVDIALLLTHHDQKWYDHESSEFYNNDINPANTYLSHLCGHLHVANTHEYGLIGAGSRRIQLAPSLFGLQCLDNKTDRIHGYYAGSYTMENNAIVEHFYPRKLNKRYDENYSIIPDFGFPLNHNGCLVNTYPRHNLDTNLVSQGASIATSEEVANDVNILDLSGAKLKFSDLEKVPTVSYICTPQHLHIRKVEQEQLIKLLTEQRYAWLGTDWGLNDAGFIGSVINQLDLQDSKSTFILNCEDVVTSEELLSLFNHQFGMELHKFCSLVNNLDKTLLVLSNLNPNLFATQKLFSRLMDIVKSVLDYSPAIAIILITRQVPDKSAPADFVKLSPLDPVQTKSYVQNHPEAETSLTKQENLEKLNDLTGGLPKHIDRIIEMLKVVSIEEIIENEQELPKRVIDEEPIPKSLLQAISTLSESSDKYKLRSLKLLKILTVLPNGEIFENLRRIDPNETFFPDNALELEQLSLIEFSSVHRIISQVSEKGDQPQLKLLKVPRQVRDFINTIITDNERNDIIKNACSLYFGSKWREGEIKNVYSSAFKSKSKYLNFDNCHVLIKNLLNDAIRNDNSFLIERAANLAINYCDLAHECNDYKNALNSSEEIYHMLKYTAFRKELAIISKIYGETLRMCGQRLKAIDILEETLELKEFFSKNDLNSIYIDLGYAANSENDFEKAKLYAEKLAGNSDKNSQANIQSKFILAEATLEGGELIKKLRGIETLAKRFGYKTLGDNISLDLLLLEEEEYASRAKRLDKVLSSKEDYTRMRAIIVKGADDLKHSGDLPENDLILLNLSYSYLYVQRQKIMFNQCHNVLWTYCIKKKRYADLLNLFKHSSFFWRIADSNDLEKHYFFELYNNSDLAIETIENTKVNLFNIEYYNRRKQELETLNPLLAI